jgi:outer membrane protein OmpA-like peptidoglycan-associated protein/uncharacterized protein YidB (DUF937 family)
MQLLSDIVRDTDENFGIGNKTSILVSEATRCLFDPAQDGLKGFFSRLEAAGHAADLANWRHPNEELRYPEGAWLEAVLGQDAVARIGRDLGMANARVRTALAYIVPRLIRFFATGDAIPESLPVGVEEFLAKGQSGWVNSRSRSARSTPRRRRNQTSRGRFDTRRFAWRAAVLVLLVSGFMLGQDIFTRTQQESQGVAEHEIPVTSSPEATKSSDLSQEQKGPGSKLVIRSDAQRIEYLGLVASPEVRRQIIEKLQKFYGSAKISGEIIVDPQRSDPLWLGALDRLLPLLNVPGLDIRLEGTAIRVGGWLSEEDRNSVLSSLMSALGSGFRYGYLREESIEKTQDSVQFLSVGLSQLVTDSKPQELVVLLNRWVIPFSEGSATFPEESRETASRIASVFGSLKTSGVIEIQGHVGEQANPPQALKLSLDRANAVRDALIKAGVAQNSLRTKGYGSDRKRNPVDTADEPGRNDRIEFRLIQVCDPYFPCGSSAAPKRTAAPDPNLPQEGTGVTGLEAPVTAPQRSTPGYGTGEVRARPVTPPDSADKGEGTPLKSLTEDVPPAPKPRPKPTDAVKPPTAKSPEWYDPLGLF